MWFLKRRKWGEFRIVSHAFKFTKKRVMLKLITKIILAAYPNYSRNSLSRLNSSLSLSSEEFSNYFLFKFNAIWASILTNPDHGILPTQPPQHSILSSSLPPTKLLLLFAYPEKLSHLSLFPSRLISSFQYRPDLFKVFRSSSFL